VRALISMLFIWSLVGITNDTRALAERYMDHSARRWSFVGL
jgi:hypothetical protein